jgi:6-phosphogluconolactonase (cycloisomerase 2 family)
MTLFEDLSKRRKVIRRGVLLVAVLASVLVSVRCGGGDDGGGNPPSNNAPPPTAASQFAYVVNYFGNTVQAFGSDANGNFTAVGTPPQGLITTGTHPHNVNVDKAGRFVYISNHDSNFVSGFKINADGSLAPINPAAGSPVTGLQGNDPTDNNPHWSVFDTTGQFLYVIAGVPPAMSTLKSYSINGTTGVLTQIGTTGALAQCSHGHNVTISPNNNFLYVACEDSGVVYSFQRDQNGMALNGIATPVPQIGPPTAPSAVVDPTSSFLFVGATNSVTVFNINPNNGTLTPMAGQNNFVAGNTPHNVRLDASGGHLYTANINDSTVSAFSVNAGVLAPLAGSPFATGGVPNQVFIHPDGQVAFTADQATDTVTRFTVNADGTLARNGNAATFPAGSGTNGIGMTHF